MRRKQKRCESASMLHVANIQVILFNMQVMLFNMHRVYRIVYYFIIHANITTILIGHN